MKNAINWFEIPATDIDRARKFYEAIFDFEMFDLNVGDGLSMVLFPAVSGTVNGALIQYEDIYKGGTLRLGLYTCNILSNTVAYETYQSDSILERHRHRYEFNNQFKNVLEANGLVFSGVNPENNLVEMIEIKDHPFFIGVQFHPEFLSRPDKPHQLFNKLIEKSKLN